MTITTTSSKLFERIALDIVGPLPLTINGNVCILTLQDDFTKFSQAYALPNHEAKIIADKLTHEFICKFGIPESTLTDQGPDFTSNLIKKVSKLFRLKKIQTSIYRPETNGALERSHQTLADFLKYFVKIDNSDLDDLLDFAMFTYNTTVHSSSKFTPFELVFGVKPNLPSSITKVPEFKYTYDDYIDNLTLKLRKSREIARENLIKSKEKMILSNWASVLRF